jgi:G3E family GTPase
MADAANAMPVTIITGFLGSGKTTVLNRLLKLPALADTAVIVNEFGTVGLDHLLIEQAIENTVLLKNGCVCCTVRGDIADTLETLWQRRDAGLLPPFRRIAIETTGLADPGPVAHALLAPEYATYACRLDGIVTTVDALHGTIQLQHQSEARRQVAMADRILLTKTDLASAEEVAAVEMRIAVLNAGAPLRHVVNGNVDANDVFDVGPVKGDDVRVTQWLRPTRTIRRHGHAHLPFRHGDDISSVVLRRHQPVAWKQLQLWLESVLSLRGVDVLRLKGLVHLVGEDRLVVLQGVHHVLHPPEYLARQDRPATNSQIVLITRGLSATALRESFNSAITHA